MARSQTKKPPDGGIVPEEPAEDDDALAVFEPQGRPLKLSDVTPEFAFAAGGLMMTQHEISELFGVQQPAVSKRLAKPELHRAWKAGQAAAKLSLRRAQFKKAVTEGNVVAQIWLGKQYLDQHDSRKEEVTQTTNVKVEYVAVWGTPDGRLPEPGETELLEGTVEDEEEEEEEEEE